MSTYRGRATDMDNAYTLARTRTDAGNFSQRLEQLHAEKGTWKAVAASLGISASRLGDYRRGYGRGRGGRRVPTNPARITSKVTRALRSSRSATLRGTDWRRLRVHVTWTIGDDYEQAQNMNLGWEMGHHPGAEEQVSKAYLDGPEAFNQAIDDFVGYQYAQVGDSHITGVDWLEI